MLWNLFLESIAGILGIWLSTRFLPGVDFNGPVFIIPYQGMNLKDYFQTLVFIGIVLGLLNFFIKPILNTIAFPLRIITLNLFSLIIGMFLLWIVDYFSSQLVINGISSLFFSTIIILFISGFLKNFVSKK